MAGLTFCTHPQSRGQTVRWMLEEVGQPYEVMPLGYGTSMKDAAYRAINPMGKVPAIIHDGKVVTEVAAICTYLADAFPEAGLAPPTDQRADYYRWMFFTSGPVEAAFTNKAMGWAAPPERERMLGYGNYDLAIDTLEGALKGKEFIASDRFSAADLFVGANINFMLAFDLLPKRDTFIDYARRMTDRPAYERATQKDTALLAELEAAQ